MKREEEIKRYCADNGFSYGACSSLSSVKASIATEAIKWADKTMIEKACRWLEHQEEMIGVSFEEDFIERFKQAMEE